MAVDMLARAGFAYAAGFRGQDLVTIVAISGAECGVGSTSGCETGFCCGGAAGIWQIQLDAHPWASLACAEDPACCAQLAYRLSGGSNFTPWCTYWTITCGRGVPGGAGAPFQRYMADAQAAVDTLLGGQPGPVPTPTPVGLPPGGAPGPVPQPQPSSGSSLGDFLLFAGGVGTLAWLHHRRPNFGHHLGIHLSRSTQHAPAPGGTTFTGRHRS